MAEYPQPLRLQFRQRDHAQIPEIDCCFLGEEPVLIWLENEHIRKEERALAEVVQLRGRDKIVNVVGRGGWR
jgi:hypothetical protein